MRVDRRSPQLIPLAPKLPLALCLVLIVVLAACTVPRPQIPAPGAPTPTPTPGAECTFTLEDGGDARVQIGEDRSWEQIQKDIKKAERYVDGFWQRHWDQCFVEADYQAPEKRGVYTDSDPQTCDGTSLESDNALYCADGHFVAYGRTLMRRATNENIGVPWAYLVVAHEWGHAVQQLLQDGGYGDLVPNPLDAKHEHQADCLAAAALWGSDYEGFLEWKPDNSVQVAEALIATSDKSPWTQVTPAGDVRSGGPLPRIAAFQAGLGPEGVKNCLANY